MVRLYITGGVVALIGLAIWKLFGTLPTDVIGMGLFGLGILIAGSLELIGLVLLPFRIMEWAGRGGHASQVDRKAAKAAKERAAARARTAARQAARDEATRDAPARPSS